jgi:hypothetical protein
VGGTCGTHGEERGIYRLLIRRLEGRRPLGRSRYRSEDNIKLDLREIRIEGSKWIRLVQDMAQWLAFVNTVMSLHKESRIFFDKLSDNQIFI